MIQIIFIPRVSSLKIKPFSKVSLFGLKFFCKLMFFASTQITNWVDNNQLCPQPLSLLIIRASNIPYADLRHIIIVGNMTFLEREWGLLRNMPKISIMNGNPLNRADIRAVKVSCQIFPFILDSFPGESLSNMCSTVSESSGEV